MKIVLCLLLIGVFTFAGYLLANKFTDRKNFYNDFDVFNKKMIGEINFAKNSLPKIINSLCANSIFNDTLKKYIQNTNSYIFTYKFLSNDELDYFYDYLRNLGESDSITQLKFLKSVEEYLGEKNKSVNDEYKKYRPLYIKLGFLFGLIAFVILI